MGFFDDIGHSINDGFNSVLPYAMAGTQVAGTALLGPQAGAAIGSAQSGIAGALGHPTLSSSNTGLGQFLGQLFGGGVSVSSGDTQVQVGTPAVLGNSNALSGLTSNNIPWLKVGMVALLVWIFWRMFGGRRKKY